MLAICLFVIVPAALSWIGGGYLFQVATTTLIFIILASSLNLVTGTAGLLSLGHAGFYGIGAYAAALLSTRLGLSFLATLPLAGVAAGAMAFWSRCRQCGSSASISRWRHSALVR